MRPPTGLKDHRLHDLGHSFASRAPAFPEKLPITGQLPDCRRNRTTAGYTPLDDAHLVEAMEKAGRKIVEDMSSQKHT